MEHALRKRDSGVAQIASFDRLLREQRDQGRGGCKSGFVWPQCREIARGRGAQVSRQENEGASSSCPSFEFGKGFATGSIAPGIDVSMNSPFAGMALKRGHFAAKDSVVVDLYRILEQLNCYKIENKQFKKVDIGEGCRDKGPMYKSSRHGGKLTIIKTEKELLTKSNTKLLSFARCEAPKGTRTGESFMENIPLMYFGFGLYLKKAIAPYCRKIF